MCYKSSSFFIPLTLYTWVITPSFPRLILAILHSFVGLEDSSYIFISLSSFTYFPALIPSGQLLLQSGEDDDYFPAPRRAPRIKVKPDTTVLDVSVTYIE